MHTPIHLQGMIRLANAILFHPANEGVIFLNAKNIIHEFVKTIRTISL